MRRDKLRGRGIRVRHARSCRIRPCSCQPSYEAWVFDQGRKRRKTFRTPVLAASWRKVELDRIHGVSVVEGPAEPSIAYVQVRRALATLQAYRAQAGSHDRRVAGVAMDALYRAEDEIVSLLR